MREIKFRVWMGDIEDGGLGMLPVSQLSWDEHDDGILRLHFCGCLDKRMQGSFGVHSGLGNVDGSEDTGCVLMQYIGLKDKNGKEIYEGDIIRIPNWTSNYKCDKCGYHPIGEGIGKVIWANESFRSGDFSHTLAQFRFEIDIEDYELDDAEQYEVIGNIYEKPELLK